MYLFWPGQWWCCCWELKCSSAWSALQILLRKRLNTQEGGFLCLVSQTIFTVSCWFCCAVLSAGEAFTYTSSRALGHCICLIWLRGCSYFPVSLVTALYPFSCWHVSAACSVLLQKSVLFVCCKMTENQDTTWGLSFCTSPCGYRRPDPLPTSGRRRCLETELPYRPRWAVLKRESCKRSALLFSMYDSHLRWPFNGVGTWKITLINTGLEGFWGSEAGGWQSGWSRC